MSRLVTPLDEVVITQTFAGSFIPEAPTLSGPRKVKVAQWPQRFGRQTHLRSFTTCGQVTTPNKLVPKRRPPNDYLKSGDQCNIETTRKHEASIAWQVATKMASAGKRRPCRSAESICMTKILHEEQVRAAS